MTGNTVTGKTVAIVNPHSGGGNTGRHWDGWHQKLEASLGPVETRFTRNPATPYVLPAEELTRQALKEGAARIIAVGGDGTINEVVNGFFEKDRAIAPEAALALFTAGTGGDFRKTFGLPVDPEACIARIANATPHTIDLGRLVFTTHDGQEARRYFCNIASFGMSGAVCQAINRTKLAKFLGGRFAYSWTSFITLLRYRPQALRIVTDRGWETEGPMSTVAVCNGRFFGGGMMIAPEAEPDDVFLDIILLRDMTLWDFLSNSSSLYDGSHLKHKKVSATRAGSLQAFPLNPEEPVLLDIDGEAPGRLPARFEIVPRALRILHQPLPAKPGNSGAKTLQD